MPGDTCVVCGNNHIKDLSVSMHRFPRDAMKKKRWIKTLGLNEDDIKDHHRVCSRHFPNADPHNMPELSLVKRFASPRKRWTSRAKRAKARAAVRSLTPQLSTCCMSRSSTPESLAVPSTPESHETHLAAPLVATVRERDSDCEVHELPSLSTDHDSVSELSCSTLTTSVSAQGRQNENTQVPVSTALLARIEALESDKQQLKEELNSRSSHSRNFAVSDIASD